MKKAVLISFLLTCAAACYKSTVSPPGDSFSAAIDGAPTNFKVVNADLTQTYLGINAAVDTSPNSPSMSLFIFLNGQLTAGSYPASSNSSPSQIDYYEDPAGVLTEYQSPDEVITITAVSNYAITGTFEGTCERVINPDSLQVVLDPVHVRVMTSGKFNVKLQ